MSRLDLFSEKYGTETNTQPVFENTIVDKLMSSSSGEIRLLIESCSLNDIDQIESFLLDVTTSSKDFRPLREEQKTELLQLLLKRKTELVCQKYKTNFKPTDFLLPFRLSLKTTGNQESLKIFEDTLSKSMQWVSLNIIQKLTQINEPFQIALLDSLSKEELCQLKARILEISVKNDTLDRLVREIDWIHAQKVALKAIPSTATTAIGRIEKAHLESGGERVFYEWMRIIENKAPSLSSTHSITPLKSTKPTTQANIKQIDKKARSILAILAGFLISILEGAYYFFTAVLGFRESESVRKARELLQAAPLVGPEAALLKEQMKELASQGEKRAQNEAQTLSLGTRLGLTIATNVVENTRHAHTSREALAHNKQELQALRQTTSEEKIPDNEESFFQKGGSPSTATLFELEAISHALSEDTLSKFDKANSLKKEEKQLNAEERVKLQRYRDNLERSQEINMALTEFRLQPGAGATRFRKAIQDIESSLDKHKNSPSKKLLQTALDFCKKYHKTEVRELSSAMQKLQQLEKDSVASDLEPIKLAIIDLLQEQIDSEEHLQHNLNVISRSIVEGCKTLAPEESFYIDACIDGHAMRLAVTKTENEFILTNYDSSGSIERSELSTTLMGLRKLAQMELGHGISPRANAMQIRVPQSVLYAKGVSYFEGVLGLSSLRSRYEQRHDMPIKGAKSMRWWEKLGDMLYLLDQQTRGYLLRRWTLLNYVDKFSALSPGQKPEFLELLQTPQVTNDCYAHRTKTNQLHELGVDLYKKVQLAILRLQRKDILDEITSKDSKYVSNDFALEIQERLPKSLSSEEAKKISHRLARLTQIPSPGYFKEWIPSTLKEIERLRSLAEEDPEDKVFHQASVTSLELAEREWNQYADEFRSYIESFHDNARYNRLFDQNDRLKGETEGKLTQEALHELSLFLSGKAWEGITALIDHNYTKLNTHRRYLSHISERLPQASYKTAEHHVSTADLIQANMVSYAIGASRQKVTAVEINIGKDRYEISVEDYFQLVARDSKALTDPRTIETVQFLRNRSNTHRQIYDQVLQRPLLNNLRTEGQSKIESTLKRVLTKLSKMMSRDHQLKAKIKDLQVEINSIKQRLGDLNEQFGDDRFTPEKDRLNLEIESLSLQKRRLEAYSFELENIIERFGPILGEHASELAAGSFARSLADLQQKFSSAQTVDLQDTDRLCMIYLKICEGLETHGRQISDLEDEWMQIDTQIYLSNAHLAKHYRKQAIDLGLSQNPACDLLLRFCGSKPSKAHKSQVFKEIEIIHKKLISQITDRVNRSLEEQTKHDVAQKAATTSEGLVDLFTIQEDQVWSSHRLERILEITKEPVTEEDKKTWLESMAGLWLRYENPEKISSFKELSAQAQIAMAQEHFTSWIEAQFHLKRTDFIEAGFSLEISPESLALLDVEQIDQELLSRHEAATKIQQQFKKAEKASSKASSKKISNATLPKVSKSLSSTMFKIRARSYQDDRQYTPISHSRSLKNTLQFLKSHPSPKAPLKSCSSQDLHDYVNVMLKHLDALEASEWVENRSSRIYVALQELTQVLLERRSETSLPASKVDNLQTLLVRSFQQKEPLQQALNKVDNSARSSILSLLLQLELCKQSSESYKPLISKEAALIAGQWKKLIGKDSLLEIHLEDAEIGDTPETAVETELDDSVEEVSKVAITGKALLEMARAIHHSSIGLEGITEGKATLQQALYQASVNSLDDSSKLRLLADKWDMRSGRSLLLHNFFVYYNNANLALDTSEQRQLFLRALHDIDAHCSNTERQELVSFLFKLIEEESSSDTPQTCLVISKKDFLTEALLEISQTTDEETYEPLFKTYEDSLKNSLKPSVKDGQVRLMALCKLISYTQVKLQSELVKTSNDSEKIDKLTCELVCLKLNYESLLDCIPQEILESYQSNIEFHQAMQKSHNSMESLASHLHNWAFELSSEQVSELESALIFMKENYGLDIDLNESFPKQQSHSLKGFVDIGRRRQWDIVHGHFYLDGNRLKTLPIQIKTHPDFIALGLHNLSFKPAEGHYVYTEDDQPVVQVALKENGELVVHRKITVEEGHSKILQHVPYSELGHLPQSVTSHFGAKTFWIDQSHHLYGFDEHYKPVFCATIEAKGQIAVKLLPSEEHFLSLSEQDIYNLELKEAISKLHHLSPAEEIWLSKNKNELFLPCLGMSFVKSETNPTYWKAKNGVLEGQKIDLKSEGFFSSANILTSLQTKQLADLEKEREQWIARLQSTPSLSLKEQFERRQIEKKLNSIQQKIFLLEKRQVLHLSQGQSYRSKFHELEGQLREKKDEMLSAYQEYCKAQGEDETDKTQKYQKSFAEYQQSEQELRKHSQKAPSLHIFEIGRHGEFRPTDLASSLEIASLSRELSSASIKNLLSHFSFPLEESDYNQIEHHITRLSQLPSPNQADQGLWLLLLLAQVRHHQMSRRAAICGKQSSWNESALKDNLHKALKERIAHIEHHYPQPKWPELRSLWQSAKAEYSDLSSQICAVHVENGPSLTTDLTFDMPHYDKAPIEQIQKREIINFKFKESPQEALDESQKELIAKLNAYEGSAIQLASIQAQRKGFLFEEFGIFGREEFFRALCLEESLPSKGCGGITHLQAESLFQWMENKGWISRQENHNEWKLTNHPKNFFSKQVLSTYLKEANFNSEEIATMTKRLDRFFDQLASSSFEYDIHSLHIDSVHEQVKNLITNHLQATLEAQDLLTKTFGKALDEDDIAQLGACYLVDDFSSLASVTERQLTKSDYRVLKNAMTRVLFHQTELDHLKDAQMALAKGHRQQAAKLLHMKRNYSIELLLTPFEEFEKLDAHKKESLAYEQKRQRAFLLFEKEFGHRCNERQADIFEGLLSDSLDPAAIDAAQARMGFGKTSLLPLIALARTGSDKLVRFIVPKSALESNTSSLSKALKKIMGAYAVKDDFSRYQLQNESQEDLLHKLKDIQCDLRLRLELYQTVLSEHKVLIQAPYVRNALEDQLKIFLRMQQSASGPVQLALFDCIALLNEIRSMKTLSVFDELDATTDPLSTQVHYTSGEKSDFDQEEILPIEKLVQTILQNKTKSIEELGSLILSNSGIVDETGNILRYITSSEMLAPKELTEEIVKPVLIARAVLSDPHMLAMITEKEAGTDFGAWFQKESDGTKSLDYQWKGNSLQTGTYAAPLLLSVPYNAANEPKAKGSRFDNSEVTAITTYIHYLDPRTSIEEVPHLEFLIETLREATYPDLIQSENGAFTQVLEKIQSICEIEDPISRAQRRHELYKELASNQALQTIRPLLVRLILATQLQIDKGKASSDRYEQGHSENQCIGFSGTAGDMAVTFSKVRLDPAADGKVTLGIMGRESCQETHLISVSSELDAENYTKALIEDLASHMKETTRVFIDVAGQCRTSNQKVAQFLYKTLQSQGRDLQGIIFYDDTTNTQTVYKEDATGRGFTLALDEQHLEASLSGEDYFTYFDQSHSRGSDIPQADHTHALLTLSFCVTNNDYKQAILRLRKIVDPLLGQSFSLALTPSIQERIAHDLSKKPEDIRGSDVAFWLRSQELETISQGAAQTMQSELRSILKNAATQQQSRISQLLKDKSKISQSELEQFSHYLAELDAIQPWIELSIESLLEKYGQSELQVSKKDFIHEEQSLFQENLNKILLCTERALSALKLIDPSLGERKETYERQARQVIAKREAQLPEHFTKRLREYGISESQAEVEAIAQVQSEASAQIQAQNHTYSFAQIQIEEQEPYLNIEMPNTPYPPASLDFLNSDDKHLAHSLPHFSHLFKQESEIGCSLRCLHKKERATSAKEPMTIARFVLYNASKSPRYILIDQDEADLFALSPKYHSEWSLLDLHAKAKGRDLLACGKMLSQTQVSYISNQDNVFKKLKLASLQCELSNTSDLLSIAKELEPVVELEDLAPSLTLRFEEDHKALANLLRFNRFGYGSRHNFTLTVKHKQVAENDLFWIGNKKLKISSKTKPRLQKLYQAKADKLFKTGLEQTLNELQSTENERKTEAERFESIKTKSRSTIKLKRRKLSQAKIKLTESLEKAQKSLKQTFIDEFRLDNFLEVERTIKQLGAKKTPIVKLTPFERIIKKILTSEPDKKTDSLADKFNLLWTKHAGDLTAIREELKELSQKHIRPLFPKEPGDSLKTALLDMAKSVPFGFKVGHETPIPLCEGRGFRDFFSLWNKHLPSNSYFDHFTKEFMFAYTSKRGYSGAYDMTEIEERFESAKLAQSMQKAKLSPEAQELFQTILEMTAQEAETIFLQLGEKLIKNRQIEERISKLRAIEGNSAELVQTFCDFETPASQINPDLLEAIAPKRRQEILAERERYCLIKRYIETYKGIEGKRSSNLDLTFMGYKTQELSIALLRVLTQLDNDWQIAEHERKALTDSIAQERRSLEQERAAHYKFDQELKIKLQLLKEEKAAFLQTFTQEKEIRDYLHEHLIYLSHHELSEKKLSGLLIEEYFNMQELLTDETKSASQDMPNESVHSVDLEFVAPFFYRQCDDLELSRSDRHLFDEQEQASYSKLLRAQETVKQKAKELAERHVEFETSKVNMEETSLIEQNLPLQKDPLLNLASLSETGQ